MDEPQRNLKPIRLSRHALLKLQSRGASEQEITETIRTAPWAPAEEGCFEARKNYPFNALWNGNPYATRQVRPVFADDPDAIVVVTVYVYYF